jgi:hypothetical protein
MHDPSAVVAERTLTRCDTGGPVIAKVFKPVPDPEEPDTTWACGYELTGLDETIRDRALGLDSMQALMLAFQGIRSELKKSRADVLFADTPGHTGFERHHLDPDMEALFENLMEAEIIRQNTLYELLDEDSDREPETELLLEHVREAEAARQRITRRILARATKGDE